MTEMTQVLLQIVPPLRLGSVTQRNLLSVVSPVRHAVLVGPVEERLTALYCCPLLDRDRR